MSGNWTVRSFSVNTNDLEILAELREIALRENSTFSKLTVAAIKEYVADHKIPNPNARLDRTLETGLPHKPKDLCCVPGCPRKAVIHLYLANRRGRQEQFPVCRLHKGWRNETYREYKGMKEL